jgi:YtkA-like
MTVLLAMLGATACDETSGDDDDDAEVPFCERDDRADAFMVDLRKTGERSTLSIVEASPAEPVRGDNTWRLRLTDASGTPMAGMSVEAMPWMPDHGHGSPVETHISDLGGGEYELAPLNLFMAGFWTVTFAVTSDTGETDELVFSVCVD